MTYQDIDYAQAHCDFRVCHEPKSCKYCDRYPEVQAKRIAAKVAFTGQAVPDGWRRCPAEVARGMESINGWGGNQPVGGNIPDAEKEALRRVQRPVSLALYGDVQAAPEIHHGDVQAAPEIHHGDVQAAPEIHVQENSDLFLKKSLSQKIRSWFSRQ